jgi:hypothetical protein
LSSDVTLYSSMKKAVRGVGMKNENSGHEQHQ